MFYDTLFIVFTSAILYAQVIKQEATIMPMLNTKEDYDYCHQ